MTMAVSRMKVAELLDIELKKSQLARRKDYTYDAIEVFLKFSLAPYKSKAAQVISECEDAIVKTNFKEMNGTVLAAKVADFIDEQMADKDKTESLLLGVLRMFLLIAKHKAHNLEQQKKKAVTNAAMVSSGGCGVLVPPANGERTEKRKSVRPKKQSLVPLGDLPVSNGNPSSRLVGKPRAASSSTSAYVAWNENETLQEINWPRVAENHQAYPMNSTTMGPVLAPHPFTIVPTLAGLVQPAEQGENSADGTPRQLAEVSPRAVLLSQPESPVLQLPIAPMTAAAKSKSISPDKTMPSLEGTARLAHIAVPLRQTFTPINAALAIQETPQSQIGTSKPRTLLPRRSLGIVPETAPSALGSPQGEPRASGSVSAPEQSIIAPQSTLEDSGSLQRVTEDVKLFSPGTSKSPAIGAATGGVATSDGEVALEVSPKVSEYAALPTPGNSQTPETPTVQDQPHPHQSPQTAMVSRQGDPLQSLVAKISELQALVPAAEQYTRTQEALQTVEAQKAGLLEDLEFANALLTESRRHCVELAAECGRLQTVEKTNHDLLERIASLEKTNADLRAQCSQYLHLYEDSNLKRKRADSLVEKERRKRMMQTSRFGDLLDGCRSVFDEHRDLILRGSESDGELSEEKDDVENESRRGRSGRRYDGLGQVQGYGLADGVLESSDKATTPETPGYSLARSEAVIENRAENHAKAKQANSDDKADTHKQSPTPGPHRSTIFDRNATVSVAVADAAEKEKDRMGYSDDSSEEEDEPADACQTNGVVNGNVDAIEA